MAEMLSKLISYRLAHISHQIGRKFSSGHNTGAVELAYSCFEPTKVKIKDVPLVILHGLFGSKKNWESLAHAFSKAGRKVITVDARNHGESNHVPEFDYISMSEDVAILLGKLSISKAILLGHSMGGKTAMCLAIRKPHLVDKLIVEDVSPNTKRTPVTTAFPQYLAAMRNVQFDQQVETLSQARRSADQQLKKIFPIPMVRSFMLTNLREGAEGYEWKVNIDAIENNLDQTVSFPTLHGIYEGETLFIGGEYSQHIGPSDVTPIMDLFPRAVIQEIAKAGHWIHYDQPYEFLDTVQRFIGDKS